VLVGARSSRACLGQLFGWPEERNRLLLLLLESAQEAEVAISMLEIESGLELAKVEDLRRDELATISMPPVKRTDRSGGDIRQRLDMRDLSDYAADDLLDQPARSGRESKYGGQVPFGPAFMPRGTLVAASYTKTAHGNTIPCA